MADAQVRDPQEEIDFEEEEEIVHPPKLVKDEEESHPQPLEVEMPTDDPQPPQSIPTTQSSAASLYPHSVTTAANIPLHISPLSAAPPLPDETRGRSSGTPQPPAAKVARTAPTTPYVPSHLLRFDNPFDPSYNQARHDALSKLRFPQTQHEEYNFWVSLYYFFSTPMQPLALPTTLASCNISRDSSTTRPFYCVKCQRGFPTMSHYGNHSWAVHLTPEEKLQWQECVQSCVTPHDLLWFFNKASLSLSPLPHDTHGLNTLPQQLRLREDGTWNPIIGLTPYHRSIVKTSTTPSYISYSYLQPSDCFDSAKSHRRLHHETPSGQATEAPPVAPPSGEACPGTGVTPIRSPFGSLRDSPASTLRVALKAPAPTQPSPFGRSQSCVNVSSLSSQSCVNVSSLSTSVPPPLTSPSPAAPLPKSTSRSASASASSKPKPPPFTPHGHTYNTYPHQVPLNNTDVLAFDFNPFDLPTLITFNLRNSGSSYMSVCDTCTFHDWWVDSSMIDLNLFRFIAPDPPHTTLLYHALDATKHLYRRYYSALPDCYFLLYQLLLHASVLHLFTLNACMCHSLDVCVPPHIHSTNNQCQRIFLVCEEMEKSLNTILHHTYLSMSTSIQDPDIPNSHLYLIYAVFSYATKLLTVEIDRPSYLLDSPRLPSGQYPSTLTQDDVNSIRSYFNRLDSQMPPHILARQR